MAVMIPDRLPDRASAGEKKLFSILQNLPDDCIVYYEPLVSERYPDFIAIIPNLGVLIIEVKGWYIRDIVDASNDTIAVVFRGREQRHRHPVRQGRDYMTRVWDECARHSFAKVLYHADGQHKGRFIFPFGHFAVLSNITREQLESHADPSVKRIFSSATVTRDELARWSDLDVQQLQEALKRFFNPWWPIETLTQGQLDALRAVIHPVQLRHPRNGEAPAESNLSVLDLQQERAARAIGSGHRVVYGVAGSGKTVLLIARAQMLAEDPLKRILLLCYNKVLASYLSIALQDHVNVTVRYFHGWGSYLGLRFREDQTADEYGEDLFRRLIETGSEVYDAVLIDEAQDFAPSWFKCAKQALKEPDDGDLLVVGDGSQSLYRSRGFSWGEVGVHARGRTTILKKNYRNTVEIIAVAQAFSSSQSSDLEDHSAHAPEIEGGTSLRSGPTPVLFGCESRIAEIEAVTKLVDALTRKGVEVRGRQVLFAPEEIAVFYPRNQDQALFETLCSSLRPFGLARLSGSAPTNSLHDPGVRLITINASKGLQYRAVILIWADLLPSNFPDRDEARERRLMYVALTRAEDLLYVTHSGPSGYISEIKQQIERLRAPTGSG